MFLLRKYHCLAGRVFANVPGDLGSIPGHIIRKTFKMVLDTTLLNTQQYKVRIKGKVEQSWERSSALPCTSFWSPSTTIANFTYLSFLEILLIMSCRQHGYPWPSLATFPYRSFPLAGLLGYIPYHHTAAVCMF